MHLSQTKRRTTTTLSYIPRDLPRSPNQMIVLIIESCPEVQDDVETKNAVNCPRNPVCCPCTGLNKEQLLSPHGRIPALVRRMLRIHTAVNDRIPKGALRTSGFVRLRPWQDLFTPMHVFRTDRQSPIYIIQNFFLIRSINFLTLAFRNLNALPFSPVIRNCFVCKSTGSYVSSTL